MPGLEVDECIQDTEIGGFVTKGLHVIQTGSRMRGENSLARQVRRASMGKFFCVRIPSCTVCVPIFKTEQEPCE